MAVERRIFPVSGIPQTSTCSSPGFRLPGSLPAAFKQVDEVFPAGGHQGEGRIEDGLFRLEGCGPRLRACGVDCPFEGGKVR